jgi:hypothetical protein
MPEYFILQFLRCRQLPIILLKKALLSYWIVREVVKSREMSRNVEGYIFARCSDEGVSWR